MLLFSFSQFWKSYMLYPMSHHLQVVRLKFFEAWQKHKPLQVCQSISVQLTGVLSAIPQCLLRLYVITLIVMLSSKSFRLILTQYCFLLECLYGLYFIFLVLMLFISMVYIDSPHLSRHLFLAYTKNHIWSGHMGL